MFFLYPLPFCSAVPTHDKTGYIGGIQYPGGLSAIYTYDSRNRVQKVTWGSVTDSFEYDLAGNLVKETRSNGTVSEYTYDAANRLTDVNHKKGSTSFAQMKYAVVPKLWTGFQCE